MRAKIVFSVFAACLVMLSCKKEDENAKPVPPIIAIQRITPDTIRSFVDSVFMYLRYEDKNGDLGFEDADIHSIEIHDSRLASPDVYHVPPLAPLGQNLHIQGVLRIRLNTLFLLGNGGAEPVTFRVRMRDRAFQWSETVISDPIVILP